MRKSLHIDSLFLCDLEPLELEEKGGDTTSQNLADTLTRFQSREALFYPLADFPIFLRPCKYSLLI